ncbi:unnamed protein product [Macrosiphum euphorbiae]|uniref:Uncharacterized protein n=1 Tax=Macrosiphum euphorbiae TaxID=13131 RepID=A0AAV0Y524_9HEMI|nr:unnamed protein product [Macrosiphum euphorbiae]
MAITLNLARNLSRAFRRCHRTLSLHNTAVLVVAVVVYIFSVAQSSLSRSPKFGLPQSRCLEKSRTIQRCAARAAPPAASPAVLGCGRKTFCTPSP